MFSMVVVLVLAANCESTSQCEDGLVCETGRCVTPAAPTVTPPPLVSEPVSESDASKVYRLNGQLCRDVTDANGVTQHECVSETPLARKAPPIRPPPTEEERRRSMAPIGPPPLDLAFNVFAHGGFASIGALSRSVGTDGFGTRYRARREGGPSLDSDGADEQALLPVDLAANAQSLGARVIRAGDVEELREALREAREADGLVLVSVAADRHAETPSYESWWDVPVAEVSERPEVRGARETYDSERARRRSHLRPSEPGR